MLVPNGEEEKEPMIIGEEAEVEPKDVVKGEDDKPCVKAYYQSLPLKLCRRKCPRSRLCHIACASKVSCSNWLLPFAKSGWNHTLFNSIEELDLHRSQQKKGQGIAQASHGEQMWW